MEDKILRSLIKKARFAKSDKIRKSRIDEIKKYSKSNLLSKKDLLEVKSYLKEFAKPKSKKRHRLYENALSGLKKGASNEEIDKIKKSATSLVISRLDSYLTLAYPEFPNMDNKEDFKSIIALFYLIYDSIVQAGNNLSSDKSFLPVDIANTQIYRLKVYVDYVLNFALDENYKLSENKMNENLLTPEVAESLGEFSWLGSSSWFNNLVNESDSELTPEFIKRNVNKQFNVPMNEGIFSVFNNLFDNVNLSPDTTVKEFTDFIENVIGEGNFDTGLERLKMFSSNKEKVDELKQLKDISSAKTISEMEAIESISSIDYKMADVLTEVITKTVSDFGGGVDATVSEGAGAETPAYILAPLGVMFDFGKNTKRYVRRIYGKQFRAYRLETLQNTMVYLEDGQSSLDLLNAGQFNVSTSSEQELKSNAKSTLAFLAKKNINIPSVNKSDIDSNANENIVLNKIQFQGKIVQAGSNIEMPSEELREPVIGKEKDVKQEDGPSVLKEPKWKVNYEYTTNKGSVENEKERLFYKDGEKLKYDNANNVYVLDIKKYYNAIRKIQQQKSEEAPKKEGEKTTSSDNEWKGELKKVYKQLGANDKKIVDSVASVKEMEKKLENSGTSEQAKNEIIAAAKEMVSLGLQSNETQILNKVHEIIKTHEEDLKKDREAGEKKIIKELRKEFKDKSEAQQKKIEEMSDIIVDKFIKVEQRIEALPNPPTEENIKSIVREEMKDIEEYKAQSEEFNKNLEKTVNDLVGKLESLQAEVDDLSKKSAEKDEKISDLESRLTDAEGQLRKFFQVTHERYGENLRNYKDDFLTIFSNPGLFSNDPKEREAAKKVAKEKIDSIPAENEPKKEIKEAATDELENAKNEEEAKEKIKKAAEEAERKKKEELEKVESEILEELKKSNESILLSSSLINHINDAISKVKVRFSKNQRAELARNLYEHAATNLSKNIKNKTISSDIHNLVFSMNDELAKKMAIAYPDKIKSKNGKLENATRAYFPYTDGKSIIFYKKYKSENTYSPAFNKDTNYSNLPIRVFGLSDKAEYKKQTAYPFLITNNISILKDMNIIDDSELKEILFGYDIKKGFDGLVIIEHGIVKYGKKDDNVPYITLEITKPILCAYMPEEGANEIERPVLEFEDGAGKTTPKNKKFKLEEPPTEVPEEAPAQPEETSDGAVDAETGNQDDEFVTIERPSEREPSGETNKKYNILDMDSFEDDTDVDTDTDTNADIDDNDKIQKEIDASLEKYEKSETVKYFLSDLPFIIIISSQDHNEFKKQILLKKKKLEDIKNEITSEAYSDLKNILERISSSNEIINT